MAVAVVSVISPSVGLIGSDLPSSPGARSDPIRFR